MNPPAVFNTYSRYYDLIHQNKVFCLAKVDYIQTLLTQQGVSKGDLLEFGSGKGKHGLGCAWLPGDRRRATETHPMRRFSLPQIDFLAAEYGIKRMGAEEFLTGKPAGEDTWGVCVTLKKI